DESTPPGGGDRRRTGGEPVPAAELENARNFSKGRFVLQLESPQGLIMFGLRREVLEGGAVEPEEVLAGIEAVTAEDVQRVAQDVIRTNALRLAVVGPFDDAERVEELLGQSPESRAPASPPCPPSRPPPSGPPPLEPSTDDDVVVVRSPPDGPGPLDELS